MHRVKLKFQITTITGKTPDSLPCGLYQGQNTMCDYENEWRGVYFLLLVLLSHNDQINYGKALQEIMGYFEIMGRFRMKIGPAFTKYNINEDPDQSW